MNFGGPLFRLGVTLIAAYIGWTLLNAYAGTLFLLCASVAGWRLWRTAATMSGQRSPGGTVRPGANRPGNPAAPPPSSPRQDQPAAPSPAPAVAPVSRATRSLDRAMAELDGMVGLASVKAEVRKLIDVLAAERERAKLGHKGEPPALHCVLPKGTTSSPAPCLQWPSQTSPRLTRGAAQAGSVTALSCYEHLATNPRQFKSMSILRHTRAMDSIALEVAKWLARVREPAPALTKWRR